VRQYTEWMTNSLAIHAPMIVFVEDCSSDIALQIRACRPSTSPTFLWQRQLTNFSILSHAECENRTHPIHCSNVDLGRIWLEKIAMVRDVCKINPFQTKWFAWYDIGMCSYRSSPPPPQSWPNPTNLTQLDPTKLNYTATPEYHKKKTMHPGSYWHCVTGCWIVHASTVHKLCELFGDAVRQLKRVCETGDRFAFLSDQAVWSWLYVKSPELFHCIGSGYGTYPAILGYHTPLPERWVSMVVPVFNTRIDFMKEAFQSIQSQTTKAGIELVVVNDGSSPACTQALETILQGMASEPRIQVLYHKLGMNCGVGVSCAEGVHRCTNELVFRMDSDDIALPTRVQTQLDYMDTHPEAPACGGQIRPFTTAKWYPPSQLPLHITLDSFRRAPIDWFAAHPTMCYRRATLHEVGNYNPAHTHMVEDYDLHLRILRRFKRFDNLPQVLLHYRYHADQMTTSIDQKGKSDYWVQVRAQLLDKWILCDKVSFP